MAAQRKSRSRGRAAKDQEFEKLLRCAAALLQDHKRPHRLKVAKKKRATTA